VALEASQSRLDASDVHGACSNHQATLAQTQQAVGNLLQALRTNSAQSPLVKDATVQMVATGILNISDHPPEPQRPSVSPLEPQSPNTSAPTSTGFTFAGVQALDSSLDVLHVAGTTPTMVSASHGLDDIAMPDFSEVQDPDQDPDFERMQDEAVADTVEEELPLNVQNAQDTGQIAAYAKLEFDDGPFYITTHSLELGRDARAYRAARARLAELKEQQRGEGSSSGNSHPSSQNKRDGGSQVKGSVVSDRGGFYGVDDVEGEAQEADEERQRQEADGPHSSNHSASSIVNPKDLYTRPPLPHFNYTAYPIDEYEREIEEIPAPVTSEHILQQEEGFLLPIHHAPVKDDPQQDVANHRSVSRRHVKIFWDDDCFKLHVKGVNGVFVNEAHYPKDAIVPLRTDVPIQIKGIKFQFKLPVQNSIESSEESDQVEDDSPNQNVPSSSATSGVEGTISPKTGRTPIKVKIKNFNRISPPPIQPVLGPDGKPKRRGPGRPPKDGIMSKRERIAKERADRDAAAKAANGGVTPEPSSRGRSGRTLAKLAPEVVEEAKPAKRKYTKRKSANQDAEDATPKLEEESEGAADDAPPTKKARVNRSESPEYPKLEELSEKDLLRPPHNYSILIYDLLKDSPKPLDLKGIYRGLKMKWPHFLYRYKDPKGWESSVRHNVNEDKLKIIEKVDRVGKGYSYRAKPGVDIEQHKKKRARSPPSAPKMSAPPQQRYQQQAQPPPSGPYSYPQGHQPPPGHGMYGHLVPTTMPLTSMAYTVSYPAVTATPFSSGAMHPGPPYATSGPPSQPMAYTMASGPQSVPATVSTGPHPLHATSGPTPFIQNPARAGTYNNAIQYPSQHSGSAPCPPAHQYPAPPPGVSPYQPFLPTGLSVISTFESSLLEGVENPSDLPRIRATLASVRNRVFEGASASSLAGGETQDERTFLHYFRHILENERFRNPGFVGWEAVRAERERERQRQAMALVAQQQNGLLNGEVSRMVGSAALRDGLDGHAQGQASPPTVVGRLRGGGGREDTGAEDEKDGTADKAEVKVEIRGEVEPQVEAEAGDQDVLESVEKPDPCEVEAEPKAETKAETEAE
jgi:Forkhead domain/FHA domain